MLFSFILVWCYCTVFNAGSDLLYKTCLFGLIMLFSVSGSGQARVQTSCHLLIYEVPSVIAVVVFVVFVAFLLLLSLLLLLLSCGGREHQRCSPWQHQQRSLGPRNDTNPTATASGRGGLGRKRGDGFARGVGRGGGDGGRGGDGGF